MKHYIKRFAARLRHVAADKKGMTLIELMIVISIIALISAIFLVPSVNRYLQKAKYETTKLQMGKLRQQLTQYVLDNNNYPSTEQGLQALVTQPTSDPAPANYPNGGYVRANDIKDAWGRPFVYTYPGQNGDEPDIMSYGADGTEGGTGYDADIKSWE
jgi:general secretion pathway protein G